MVLLWARIRFLIWLPVIVLLLFIRILYPIGYEMQVNFE